MPVRLGAEYVDQNDQRRAPVMLHRAILGSLERFIGMLIENHAGAMPPWLAPVQAVVCCISEPSADYAAKITQSLKNKALEFRPICVVKKSLVKFGNTACKRFRTSLSLATRKRKTGQSPCVGLVAWIWAPSLRRLCRPPERGRRQPAQCRSAG